MDMATARDLLLRDDVRAAFTAWFQAKHPGMDKALVKALNNPMPGLWQSFIGSEAYTSMNIDSGVSSERLSLPRTEPISYEPPGTIATGPLPEGMTIVYEPPIMPEPPVVTTVTDDAPVMPSNNGHSTANQDVIAVLARALEAHGISSKTQEMDIDSITEIARTEAKIAVMESFNSGAIRDSAHDAIMFAVHDGLLVTEKKISIHVNDNPPVVVDGVAPKWFARAYKLATLRKNIMLVGPKGCGKTHGAGMIAKALGLPFYFSSLTAGVDESEFKGVLNPLSGEYIDSSYIKAYKHGGLYLADEFDAADPNATIFLNASTSNGHLSIPLRKDEQIIARHPDFVFIAAANTHGHGANRAYVGRNQLDASTLDRFAIGTINIDYDEDMEAALYEKRVVQYGQRLRERCRSITGWTRDVSTRNIKDANDLFASGMFTLESSWYGFFSDWKEQELNRVDVIIDHEQETAVLH